MESYDLSISIAVFGYEKTGKTSLIRKYIDEK